MTAQATQAPPKAVPLLIDFERGSKSVRGSIESGKIKRIHAPTFAAVDKIIWELESAREKPAGLILDPINSLSSVTLQDVVKENPRGLWVNRATLKASYNDYGQSNGLIIRLLRVAHSMKIPVIITCSDGEREDESLGMTMHFPNLPKQLREDVCGRADAVLRLTRTAALAEIEGKRCPKGTRIVQCAQSDTVYAKIRVPDNLPPAPDVIANDSVNDWTPAVKRLNQISGGLFEPDEFGEISPVVVYGPFGVGKTRFAVELLVTHNNEKKDN